MFTLNPPEAQLVANAVAQIDDPAGGLETLVHGCGQERANIFIRLIGKDEAAAGDAHNAKFERDARVMNDEL
jgi:hypothetical protein